MEDNKLQKFKNNFFYINFLFSFYFFFEDEIKFFINKLFWINKIIHQLDINNYNKNYEKIIFY